MTVSPIDPTGTELAHGRYEAIDFTIDTDPAETVIAVRFDELGTWEVACWEGTFAEQYALASSRDGGTYSLVRTGGWPAAPSAYVKEVETADGGQTWGALYEVDFTALAAQTMTAAGSYTIDGLTWWAKAALPAGGTCGLVAGSGLNINKGGAAAGWTWNQGAGVGGRSLYLPFENVPGYLEGAPLLVQYRYTRSGFNTSNRAYFGVANLTRDSTAPAGSRTEQVVTFVNNVEGSQALTVFGTGSSAGSNPVDSFVGVTAGDHQHAIFRPVPQFFVAAIKQWSGSFAAPDTLTLVSALMSPAAASSALGFWFSVQSSENTPMNYFLTHLKISQPMVAP